MRSKISASPEGEGIAVLQESYFNILWTWRTSFVSASSWDDERCKSLYRSVAVTEMHLLSDDKINSELPESSSQCFAFFNIFKYELNIVVSYQSFLGSYCKNYWEPLKEVMLYGSFLNDPLTVVLIFNWLRLVQSFFSSCNSYFVNSSITFWNMTYK